MFRVLSLIALLSLAACGLADDERDEDNKHIYIRFVDPAFEAFCKQEFDLDKDGRISRYEAQRVVRMNCAEWNITSLSEIGEFSNLRRLDCSRNQLTTLDVTKCPQLESLLCGENRLASLDVEGLRALLTLGCTDNALASLNLLTNTSLSTLECGANDLRTLDISSCARVMQLVDTRGNASLTTLYYASGQQILRQLVDGHTELVGR